MLWFYSCFFSFIIVFLCWYKYTYYVISVSAESKLMLHTAKVLPLHFFVDTATKRQYIGIGRIFYIRCPSCLHSLRSSKTEIRGCTQRRSENSWSQISRLIVKWQEVNPKSPCSSCFCCVRPERHLMDKCLWCSRAFCWYLMHFF